MTLVNRVSLFFLTALAISLAGYSVLSYVLIRGHLVGQFDRQLENALNVLVAAVEVEDEGVKWEPSDHTITLGVERDADAVRWVITDEHGRVVDRSRNLGSPSVTDRALLVFARSDAQAEHEIRGLGEWRFLRKRLSAPLVESDEDERGPEEFDAAIVTVALPAAGLRAELVRLGLLLSVLPAGLWCVAALVGRSYCRRALGPVRAMAARAGSVTQADFRLRLPVGPHRDELADLATAFNGLLGRLQQAFEQQRRFTGDAAHQLRTPLTVLRGEIDVALRRPRPEAEYRRVLVELSEQTAELQAIVEALLFLARAEGDALPPESREIVLADWLREVQTRWRDHPRAADLVFEIDPAARVLAAPPLLGQAVDNLVSNALKYSPPGTPVIIRASARGDEVALSVQDHGMGIAEDDRRAIFEPFFRSAQARQSGAEGIGLGLALVARIARVHGGRVECESHPHAGSRFTLHLPTANGRHSA
jgi:heavy metal sensor kinase